MVTLQISTSKLHLHFSCNIFENLNRHVQTISISLHPNEGDVWKPCQVLWSKFWPKNHVSIKAGINSNSFGPFSDFFSKNYKKIGEKCKPTKNC